MKKLLSGNPVLSISIVFIFFFTIPQLVAFLSPNDILFLLLVIVVLTGTTWLLYKTEGKNLSAIGLNATPKNLYFLPIGLLTGVLLFFSLFLLQMLHTGIKIEVNPAISYTALFTGLLILLLRVIIEELIFRGYCFQKTVDRAGIGKANVIFAFLFIVWHWVATNAWGNYGLMLGLFTTGFAHILFATAWMRSKTLYFPIGIHLGNNWMSEQIFSYQTKGVTDSPHPNGSFFNIIPTDQHFTKFHVLINYSITIAVFLAFTLLILQWRRKKPA